MVNMEASIVVNTGMKLENIIEVEMIEKSTLRSSTAFLHLQ